MPARVGLDSVRSTYGVPVRRNAASRRDRALGADSRGRRLEGLIPRYCDSIDRNAWGAALFLAGAPIGATLLLAGSPIGATLLLAGSPIGAPEPSTRASGPRGRTDKRLRRPGSHRPHRAPATAA